MTKLGLSLNIKGNLNYLENITNQYQICGSERILNQGQIWDMYLLLDFLSIKYSNMGGLFTKVAYTPPKVSPLVLNYVLLYKH